MIKSESEIIKFEQETGYVLSQELKECLVGFESFEGEYLSNVNSFGEWKKVKEYDWFSNTEFDKNEEEVLKNTYIIGNIMINSHQWGINFNNSGDVEEIIELDTYKVVAASFKEFLDKVQEDPYGLVG